MSELDVLLQLSREEVDNFRLGEQLKVIRAEHPCVYFQLRRVPCTYLSRHRHRRLLRLHQFPMLLLPNPEKKNCTIF